MVLNFARLCLQSWRASRRATRLWRTSAFRLINRNWLARPLSLFHYYRSASKHRLSSDAGRRRCYLRATRSLTHSAGAAHSQPDAARARAAANTRRGGGPKRRCVFLLAQCARNAMRSTAAAAVPRDKGAQQTINTRNKSNPAAGNLF